MLDFVLRSQIVISSLVSLGCFGRTTICRFPDCANLHKRERAGGPGLRIQTLDLQYGGRWAWNISVNLR